MIWELTNCPKKRLFIEKSVVSSQGDRCDLPTSVCFFWLTVINIFVLIFISINVITITAIFTQFNQCNVDEILSPAPAHEGKPGGDDHLLYGVDSLGLWHSYF